MNDMYVYHVLLQGQVDAGEVNALSPIQMVLERENAGKELPFTGTRLAVCTDQSGLMGILRHLHGMGLVILSVSRTGPAP